MTTSTAPRSAWSTDSVRGRARNAAMSASAPAAEAATTASSLLEKWLKKVRSAISASAAICSTVTFSTPCRTDSRSAASRTAARVASFFRSRRPSTGSASTPTRGCVLGGTETAIVSLLVSSGTGPSNRLGRPPADPALPAVFEYRGAPVHRRAGGPDRGRRTRRRRPNRFTGPRRPTPGVSL
jgi:hypothetical protein